MMMVTVTGQTTTFAVTDDDGDGSVAILDQRAAARDQGPPFV